MGYGTDGEYPSLHPYQSLSTSLKVSVTREYCTRNAYSKRRDVVFLERVTDQEDAQTH